MTNFKQEKQRDKKWLLAQREMSCIFTGSDTVEVCHVRKGSHTGISQKPHDYYTLSLDHNLHRLQHSKGEISFYQEMMNEYPLTMMEMVLGYAKLRYVTWLIKNGRAIEAIKILDSESHG